MGAIAILPNGKGWYIFLALTATTGLGIAVGFILLFSQHKLLAHGDSLPIDPILIASFLAITVAQVTGAKLGEIYEWRANPALRNGILAFVLIIIPASLYVLNWMVLGLYGWSLFLFMRALRNAPVLLWQRKQLREKRSADRETPASLHHFITLIDVNAPEAVTYQVRGWQAAYIGCVLMLIAVLGVGLLYESWNFYQKSSATALGKVSLASVSLGLFGLTFLYLAATAFYNLMRGIPRLTLTYQGLRYVTASSIREAMWDSIGVLKVIANENAIKKLYIGRYFTLAAPIIGLGADAKTLETRTFQIISFHRGILGTNIYRLADEINAYRNNHGFKQQSVALDKNCKAGLDRK
jgi:hypothetical protein